MDASRLPVSSQCAGKTQWQFLVTVNKQGSSTIEDHIIEIDRNTKEIIRTWDLNQSLQYSRQTLATDTVDWIHVNALFMMQAIILSSFPEERRHS
jgi:hypothetical protein